jgi:hypothetical protein
VSQRLATVFYSIAVVVIPVGVASKFLLGIEGATWVDPTLLLSVAAMLALILRWEDFFSGGLLLVSGGTAILFLTSVLCALSGMLIRPPKLIYDVLREPLRLWLNLCFFVVSCWFLVHKPRVVLRCSAVAVIFGLGSGIYLYLVAFGIAPASTDIISYTRAYQLRQTLWFNGIPIPRMGGLFFESPPFGLFMYSMLVVLFCTRTSQPNARWTVFAISLAILGVLASLADQVLLAGSVGLLSSLPQLAKKRPGVVWPSILMVSLAICVFEFQSIKGKNESSTTGIVSYVNGSSVGERSFHIHYGLSLLQADPAAAFFGIGPGRYGEYASETGMFVDTVSIQTSELELLVEWGGIGFAILVALFAVVSARAWQVSGVLGIGLLISLILADSFQANWKYEAFFLAVAALCTRKPPGPLNHQASDAFA